MHGATLELFLKTEQSPGREEGERQPIQNGQLAQMHRVIKGRPRLTLNVAGRQDLREPGAHSRVGRCVRA